MNYSTLPDPPWIGGPEDEQEYDEVWLNVLALRRYGRAWDDLDEFESRAVESAYESLEADNIDDQIKERAISSQEDL